MGTKPQQRKRDRGALEKDIQREICDWLFSEKYFFWRSNNLPVFSMRNDGTVKPRALPKYTPKGLPDIILLYKGKFVALEVKRPDAKLRPEQAEFGYNVVLNGGDYHRVTSLVDVINIFAK